ncbi:MAG: hypothetical protein F6K40_05810 [Okeania sp. SIO3I5]|uniref:hypothetical protein n=1 Tax=Okeania sp. SIO3I5 TaxID=2607805 RepID=UPI0013B92C74|nr:hypothetical protein [Okeania sp. SIO3I5]NEQ35824.1 hypothetical protein [Okeania sp. SIO3I5]
MYRLWRIEQQKKNFQIHPLTVRVLKKMYRLWRIEQQKKNFQIHPLTAGASQNVLTIALYAIEEKFDDSSPHGAGCFKKCIGSDV